MNIDDLTLGQIREIQKLACGIPTKSENNGRWKVGSNYFVRTVTHHFVGKLEEVTSQELWFSSVAWVADDGRFNELLKDGKVNEVEPAPEGDVALGRGTLIDAHLWSHALLRSVK